mmetsp:Transcript_41951/g.87680  ORF Transcript_41951/g.87680 Transcript_41951/m.87680 type:complete len:216 (+) Transcript_41951:1618-2265(+)
MWLIYPARRVAELQQKHCSLASRLQAKKHHQKSLLSQHKQPSKPPPQYLSFSCQLLTVFHHRRCRRHLRLRPKPAHCRLPLTECTEQGSAAIYSPRPTRFSPRWRRAWTTPMVDMRGKEVPLQHGRRCVLDGPSRRCWDSTVCWTRSTTRKKRSWEKEKEKICEEEGQPHDERISSQLIFTLRRRHHEAKEEKCRSRNSDSPSHLSRFQAVLRGC